MRCPVSRSVGGCGARAVSRKTPIYFMIDLQKSKLLFFDASVFNFLRLTRWKDCLRACRFEVRDNFGPANMIISMFRLECGLFCQIIDLVSWGGDFLGPLVPSFCLFQHQTSHRIGDWFFHCLQSLLVPIVAWVNILLWLTWIFLSLMGARAFNRMFVSSFKAK